MRALLEDKDYSQAANDLSQAIEHGNEEATTFLYLGQALARSGRDSEALRTFQRGVAAYPYDVPLWRGVATEYLRLYDRQRALEAMRKHLELFPEDAPMRDLMKKVEGYEP
jgi:tetratricopeptide (TPR) repeat protein